MRVLRVVSQCSPMDNGVRTYTVEFDAQANAGITNAYIAATWDRWVVSWANLTGMFYVIGIIFYEGEVWTCEMSDEGWSHQNRKGVKTRIPWTAMKVTHALHDAWIVEYDSTIVTVYRAPLRGGGLDHEFGRLAGWRAP